MLDDGMRELAEEAARKAVKEFTKLHPCRFSEETAKTLHEIHEAKVAENADGETFRIIVQCGKDWQDITKSFRRKVIAGLVVFVVILTGRFWWPVLVKWVSTR